MPDDERAAALSRPTALSGLAIFGAAALPIADGWSFVDLVVASGGLGRALMLVLVLGSPFLFGLAVGLGGFVRSEALAAGLIKAPLVMMHVALVYVGLSALFGFPQAAPLLGFGVVSGVAFAGLHAGAEAAGRPLGSRWLAGWGGLLVAGASAWLFAQDLEYGPALPLLLVAGAALALGLRGGRER